MEQAISVERVEWVPVFTGLPVRQFRKLVRSSQGGAVNRPARYADGGCRWPTGCC